MSYEPTMHCCGDVHVWVFHSTNAGGEIPEGTRCLCGKMVAHYDACPMCGHKQFAPLNREQSAGASEQKAQETIIWPF